MKKTKFVWMSLAASFAFTACVEEAIEYNGDSGVTVATPTATWEAGGTSLTVSSSASGETDKILWSGFCYSTSTQTPTISNDTVEADSDFTATITDLNGTQTYYVRAYVYTQSMYTYSETLEVPLAELSLEEQLALYEAPTYADDYTSIADWSYRSQWNLANVHDPTVVLADDGYYYMYQTDASYGNAHLGNGHFHARRSKNLVDWEYMGSTMDDAPAWVTEKLNEYREELGLDPIEEPSLGYWAPCVRKVSTGLYRMYYSIVVDNYIGTGAENTTANFDGTWTERAFIGLMETSDPAGNVWEDKGMVICSSSDKGTDWSRNSTDDYDAYFKWNAIDPSYIIDEDGSHYLIYGSWHSGIAIVELDPDTGLVKNELPEPWADDISAYGSLIATRDMSSRWQGSEGPEIVYRDGYYYLFLAYDALAVPYNTRVVRATNIAGPYYGMDGTNVTANGGDAYPILTHPYKFEDGYGWVGISHCCVFDDGNDNWYFASQARYPENVGGNAYSNAIMMGHVRSMRWTEDGWPIVMPERYGAVPQATISEDELVGEWEHIDLGYSYGNMKESSTMTLSEDGTVTEGTWAGTTWTFDSSNNTIVFGNGITVYIQREVDWEADTRVPTIVYAGFNSGSNKTYWGKKKTS